MNNIRFISFFSLIMLLTGCSSVRLAVYDYQKRHDYALESKVAFVHSPFVKEKAAKAALPLAASQYIGTRYKYGSCDPSQGLDCSGLVYAAAKSQNLNLPRSSGLMAASSQHIPWKKAETGDLVFFGERNHITHVGIVENNHGNKLWVIHSTSSSGVIKENVLASSYWKRRILFAINILPTLQRKS